jgi:ribosomal protein S18 acetylase RimI-like enzyme
MRICSYLESQILLFPRTVIFTAIVTYDEDTGDSGDCPIAPTSFDAGQTPDAGPKEALVGTGEVSFDRSTHSTRLTLLPPSKCAYVTNMAVAPAWRRRGVGRQLLRALEQVHCG